MNNDLLFNYLRGTCTTREEEVVEHWLNESPQNEKAMEEFKRILEVSPGKRIEVDTHKAWEAFSEQHFSDEGSILQEDTDMRLSNDHKNVRRLRHQKFRHPSVVAYGAAAAAVVLLAILFYYAAGVSTPDGQPTLASQVITTEKGQRTTVRLSDGTRIHLNAESRLTVAADYDRKKNRIVYLEGEALFKVAPDKQRPFEVHTDQSVTRALGTSFNVTAYPDQEDVQVVVSEGKVALSSSRKTKSPEVQLTRNQKAIIFPGGAIEASKVSDLALYLDWSRGRLTFRDAPLKEVEQKLERWFNIQVTMGEGISRQTRGLTGTFKDVPLSSVLHSIALSLDMDYRLEERTVIFE